MLYSAHPPSSPLSNFVDSFWFLRDAPGHERERIVPSGTIELVFNSASACARTRAWRDESS